MAVFKIQGENKEVFPAGENFDRSTRSDRPYTKERIAQLEARMVHRFRCCDDDGVTYFWGVCSNDSSFAPLDCVGVEYGCSYIEYKNPETGKYEEL